MQLLSLYKQLNNRIMGTNDKEVAKKVFGEVVINIEGQGFIHNAIINEIKKSLSRFQGPRKLLVNGVEVNPYI